MPLLGPLRLLLLSILIDIRHKFIKENCTAFALSLPLDFFANSKEGAIVLYISVLLTTRLQWTHRSHRLLPTDRLPIVCSEEVGDYFGTFLHWHNEHKNSWQKIKTLRNNPPVWSEAPQLHTLGFQGCVSCQDHKFSVNRDFRLELLALNRD